MVIPGWPASPRNSAYSDQRVALTTPIETSVSIVVEPCRRFVQAALWNGQAAQVTTGAARVRDAHCQKSNCRTGNMPRAITGIVSTMLTTSRSRNGLSSSDGSVLSATGGVGNEAV